MAVQGQTFFGITGDEGSTGCIPNGFGTNDFPFGYGSPTGLALDPSTETLYTTLASVDEVEVVDATTGTFQATYVTVGSDPTAIAVDSTTHEAFVANQGDGTVSVFSTATCNAAVVSDCTTIATIPVGTDPDAIAVDPVTGTVYVANSGGTLSVISEATVISDPSASVVGTVTLGGSPSGVAIDTLASDNRVYVTNSSSDNVSEIAGASCDATTSTCTAPPVVASTGTDPLGLAYDSGDGDVYVANDDVPGTLSVFAGATLKPVTTITVGDDPVAVALSPSGEQILAAGQASGDEAGVGAISVVSTAKNRLTTYLADGTSPSSVVSDATTNSIWSVDPTEAQQTLIYIPLYPNVWDPGTQPFATSVGGTELTSVTPKRVEAAWNETLNSLTGVPEGAGGGGISQVFPMPSWQKGRGVVNRYSSGTSCDAPAGYCREAPDVSAAADWMHGYIIYYEGTWQGYGGTSAAAPFWAGLTALIDARSSSHRLGLLAPLLYKLVAAGRHDLNDITTGNNDYSTADNGEYPATPGYDLATGLGSPIASGLAADLLPAFLPTVAPKALAGGEVARPYAVQLRDTGTTGRIVWRLAGKLPRGLRFSSAGLLSGTPKSSGTFDLTVSVHAAGLVAATAETAYTLVIAR